MKKFILDTNVLMYDPKALSVFSDNEVIIPISVLDELDVAKMRSDELGRNARSVTRILDELRNKGSLSKGVKLNEATIRVELNHSGNIPEGLSLEKKDHRLIGVALGLKNAGDKVIVITKDINLRVKCDVLGIEAQDYVKGKIAENLESVYSGVKNIEVTSDFIDLIYKDGLIVSEEIKGFPNQFFVLKSGSQSALAIYKENRLELCKCPKEVWGIHPRNVEQKMALKLLTDPDIKLVTLIGKAGGGKSLLACCAALHAVMKEQKNYQRILISRPIQPMGKDLGFLPGPQPLDAKLLTPTGWKLMGEIKLGDEVIGRDGNPTKVIGIYPKGIKKVYKITTSEGNSTECCEDHLWYVQNQKERKNKTEGKIRSTKEIKENLYYGKILNYSLPRNEIIKYKNEDISIPSYTFGALLGDGSFKGRICLYSVDKQIVDRVGKEVASLGYKLSNCGLRYTIVGENNLVSNKNGEGIKKINIKNGEITNYKSFSMCARDNHIKHNTLKKLCKTKIEKLGFMFERIKNNRFTNLFREEINNLGLLDKTANQKFIPPKYKYASISDRIDLLQGLMDTDGSVKKTSGEAVFTTTSKQLSEDIVEVTKSLGGRASVRERDRRGERNEINGFRVISRHIQYDVSIRFGNDINPFYLERKSRCFKSTNTIDKIKNIEYVGEKDVQCIKVENPEHLYITDDFIVTHNTIDEKLQPWMQPIYDNLELLLGADYSMLNEYKYNGLIQVEPLTYIRGRSIPRSFMILDESQNMSAQEIKTVITRMGEDSKIVLTGDIDQIDNPYIDFADNGLTHAVERFKDQKIAGHITLRKGERSELATLAAEIL